MGRREEHRDRYLANSPCYHLPDARGRVPRGRIPLRGSPERTARRIYNPSIAPEPGKSGP